MPMQAAAVFPPFARNNAVRRVVHPFSWCFMPYGRQTLLPRFRGSSERNIIAILREGIESVQGTEAISALTWS
jgi:hypothetical protein